MNDEREAPMEHLAMVTDEIESKSTSGNPDKITEIPEEVEIGDIILKPGETFYYTAWGIRYRFKGGSWRVAENIAFRNKSNTEDWMKEHYLIFEGMEGEVVPAKRCLLLDNKGYVTAWTEALE